GPIAVPCCGTGAELSVLADRHPERELVGIDLSAGMIEVARQTAAPNVRFIVGDASTLPGTWAAVVSCFGLQQLPNPAAALSRWCQALSPGGRLAVAVWTADIQDEGPYDALRAPTQELFGTRSSDWNARLHNAVQAHATVVSDALVPYSITHAGPLEFWRAMVSDGPWQPRLVRYPEKTAALRETFLDTWPPGAFSHRPHARVLVADAP
ncbi:MAG: methyltransferase type 11, partial [Deltaproteobacteria bacterium]|nr:methyltransferase type 11 [Deltaproteobacteria bacterium]